MNLLYSCLNDCSNLYGEYQHSEYYQKRGGASLSTYDFRNGSVNFLNLYRASSQAKSMRTSDDGNYRIEGDNLIMNFGGSDVYGYINKDSKGCINSIEIHGEFYTKK